MAVLKISSLYSHLCDNEKLSFTLITKPSDLASVPFFICVDVILKIASGAVNKFWSVASHI